MTELERQTLDKFKAQGIPFEERGRKALVMRMLRGTLKAVEYVLALYLSIGLSMTGFRGLKIWKWFRQRIEKQ